MTPGDYVRALRRRWFDVVLAVAIALGAGYFLSRVAPPGPVTRSYEATSVLLVSGDQFSSTAPNISALAQLTTVGEVPTRVAEQLGGDADPAEVVVGVNAEADTQAGIVRITAIASTPERAIELATTFGRQLIAYVRELQAESVSDQVGPLEQRLETLQRRIDELDRRIAQGPPRDRSLLEAERDASVRQYGLVYEAYQQLAESSTQPLRLSVIPPAAAHEVANGGIEPPRSPAARLGLAGMLGLISGVILVLILDRFDGRIRTRHVTERAFGRPVLAEAPALPRRKRRRASIATLSYPRSVTADAYRTLALQLSMPLLPPADRGGSNGNGSLVGNGEAVDDGREERGASAPAASVDAPRTILVTSPGPGDGKTTVAANLAVALARRGRRCVVLSCDLRRPKIHRLFGVPNDAGFAEALEPGTPTPILRPYVVPATNILRVWVVPSGPPPPDPGELMSSPAMRLAVEEARRVADVVVIDTAPLLTTSDAANIVAMVDAVVIVARAGRTTSEVAQRTTDLIARLGGTITGVVLNAVTEMSVPRRYYYYRYYTHSRGAKPKVDKGSGRGKPQLVRHGGGD